MAIKIQGSTIIDDSRNIVNAGVTTTETLSVGIGGTILTTTGIGSVGIGTANPTEKLHIFGNTHIQTGIGNTIYVTPYYDMSGFGTFDNNALLVSPQTPYYHTYDANRSTSPRYRQVGFNYAIKTDDENSTPTIEPFSNIVNVSGIASLAGYNATGFTNMVTRSDTQDISTDTNTYLTGIYNVVRQGWQVSNSSSTEDIYVDLNSAIVEKATVYDLFVNYSSTNIGRYFGGSSFRTYVDRSYNYYAVNNIGLTAGTGIATVTNLYSYYAKPTVNARGRVENYYGLYLDSPTVTGIITNRYSIYSTDTSSPMYHAGSVGIGTTNPTSRLSVVGDANITGITTTATLSVGIGGTILTTTGIGSVGIGNTNPSEKLSVTGNAIISGNTTINGTTTINNTTNIRSNLNYIGNVTPDSQLYIGGSPSLGTPPNNVQIFIGNSSVGSRAFITSSSLSFDIYSNSSSAPLVLGSTQFSYVEIKNFNTSKLRAYSNRVEIYDNLIVTGNIPNITGVTTISGDAFESYELDDISSSTDGVQNTFAMTVNYQSVSISNPFKLMITVNGILQSAFINNTDYVFQSHFLGSNNGYTVDDSNNIKFTESVPSGSEVVIRVLPVPNTPSMNKVKFYPFKPTNILLGY